LTLHHRIDGAGDDVVVLAGGLGSTLEMWERQVALLAERFRIVRYDHPGHGGSPLLDVGSVRDLTGALLLLLDNLGLARVSFCGVSLGGAVAMQFALDAPERLRRLVLCATSARFSTPEFWEERAATVRRDGVEAVADVVLDRWFTPEFADVRRYRDMLVSTSAEGYARCCDALRDWDARGSLRAVSAPVLAIAGADDPSTPPEDLRAIVDEIPRARLVVVDGARHFVNVERADQVNDALLSHL
jgi:3-oxoadipate enol-lactonase